MNWFKRKDLEWSRHPNNEPVTWYVAMCRKRLYDNAKETAKHEHYCQTRTMLGFNELPPVPLLDGPN